MSIPKNTILIAGYYGFQNLGDEMILSALLEGLQQAAPDQTVMVVSGDLEDTQARHRVEAVPWTDLDAITGAIENSRLVILGGGGLFHDRHDFALDVTHLLTPHHAGLTYYTDICLMAHLQGVPYILAGVGVGPLRSQAAQELTAWCFQHADAATVRDQDSLEQLRNLHRLLDDELERIQVAADLAFLHPFWSEVPTRAPAKDAMTRVAVIPRSWSDERGDRTWEGELAQALAQTRADEIVFLPFQSLAQGDAVDDRQVCRRIMAHPSLSGRRLTLEDPPLTLERVVEVLAGCSAVVAMRYHGAVAGLLAGRPVLAMAYDPKVTALMEQVGQGKWAISPDDWMLDKLRDQLEDLMEQKLEIDRIATNRLKVQAKITQDSYLKTLRSKAKIPHSDRFMAQALIDAKKGLEDLQARLISQEQQVIGLEHQLQYFKQRAANLSQEIGNIHSSRYWKALGWYWRVRNTAGRLWRRVRRAGRGVLPKPLFQQSARQPPAWQDWELPPAQPGKVDILFFPIIDWDFRFQRPQQLAQALARAGHRIFYLQTTFNPGGLRQKPIADNIYQLQLPGSEAASIYEEAPSESEVTQWMGALAGAAHAAGIAEAVCLVQLPYWEPLAVELSRANGWKLVYDCLDDHAGFATNAAPMLALEEELLARADLVLATSENLYQRCRSHNENVQRLPNAADLGHFSQASEKMSRPDDFPDVDGPVVGYIGAISDWFDFDLLRHAVDALPKATFYLIGDDWGSDPHADLAANPKVYFAGEKPYQSLPAYLAQFDVCLIPFKDTALTRSTDPVKLYEYLAAGKSVVARDLPELARFSQSIHLAATPEAFTQAIGDALNQVGGESSLARQQAVRDHGWDDRVEKLSGWVESLFKPVSLVMPVWNQLEQTRDCLASLRASTRYPNLEIIVVDNGSEAETARFLDQWAQEEAHGRVLHLPENVGFAPAINLGLQDAGGEIFGILNNDILLTRGWLSKLVGHLKRDPTIGMIGPVSNAVGNEAKLPFDSTNLNKLETFSSQLGYQYAGRSAPIPMLAMFCVLLPRSVFLKVGGLDERFGVGMFEDDDYAIRLRRAGYRPACARDVFIYHHGQASFNQLGAPRYQVIFRNNKAAFESKWGIAWPGHHQADLDDYEQAFVKITNWLSDLKPIVLPTSRHEGEKRWRKSLESYSFTNHPWIFWGQDGTIEVDSGDGTSSNLPWVALDAASSPLLVGWDSSPPKEVWLRLRAPEFFHPPSDTPGP